MADSPFTNTTLDDAKAFVTELQDAEIDIAGQYAAGDSWRDGDGYTGPRISKASDGSEVLESEILRSFTPRGTIPEILNRHVAATIGQEPDWGYTPRKTPPKVLNPATGKLEPGKPTKDDQALIDEAVGLMTEWWDRRGVSGDAVALGLLQQATRKTLWSERGPLRLVVPSGFLTKTDDGTFEVKAAPIETWLKRIYLKVPDIDVFATAVDPDTENPLGVFLFTESDEPNATPATGQSHADKAELHYFDENGNAVIEIVDEKDNRDTSAPYDLGGNLAVYEMRREALITSAVTRQQQLLDKTITALGHDMDVSIHPETFLLNVEIPWSYAQDPIYPTDPTKKIKVANPLYRGTGVTNAFSGNAIYGNVNDKSQITGYTSPDVKFKDPSPVDSYERSADMAYRAMLSETFQLHALISGDAAPSGESRIQALTDFHQSLLTTATQVNAAGRWLLEAVLNWAAHLAGQPGRYASLRGVFQVRLYLGPVPVELQRVIMEQVEKRLISRTTAMALLGRDDPEAEAAKIEAESPQQQQAVLPAGQLPMEPKAKQLVNGKANEVAS